MEQTNNKTEQQEKSLKALIRAELDFGIAASGDPLNSGLPDLALRTTTVYSPWYTRTCPECKHKFREGDQVRLCPRCKQAYHDDNQYNLNCWQAHFENGRVCKVSRYDPIAEVHQDGCDFHFFGKFADIEESCTREQPQSRRIKKISRQFMNGLKTVWQPLGEHAVQVVEPGDAIVGQKCPWCRFQIRAGDHVVKCPCGKCNTYFHNDIYRNLTCWNDWNGTQGMNYCPTTGTKIEKKQTNE